MIRLSSPSPGQLEPHLIWSDDIQAPFTIIRKGKQGSEAVQSVNERVSKPNEVEEALLLGCLPPAMLQNCASLFRSSLAALALQQYLALTHIPSPPACLAS